MSEVENLSNIENQENKENNSIEQKNITPNNQIPQQEKNIISENTLKNDSLKFGEYYLTPLQSILLNKKFPHGFKLETEENIAKSLELKKAQEKKQKQIQKNNQQIGRRSSNKFTQQPKKNKSSNNYENIPNNISHDKIKLYKKCKGGFDKIKESKYFNKYYTSNDINTPCLSAIEKKINNGEYNSLYEFEMDVRNIWGHYFNLNPNDDIAKKMSEDWEKICTELENPNSELNVEDIKKRTDNIKKEMEKIKDHNDMIPAPVKKSGQNSDNNKPMTVEEKNQLGNNIRSLNKEQLKGIIKILNESDTYPKSKYFEFDIDKLPTKKLRDLEKYVKECINQNLKNKKNQNGNNNNVNKAQNLKENVNNKNNTNITTNNNNQTTNVNQISNSKNKETNKNKETKQENQTDKKSKQNSNKKVDKRNESFSSDSMSSDSSLSG